MKLNSTTDIAAEVSVEPPRLARLRSTAGACVAFLFTAVAGVAAAVAVASYDAPLLLGGL